ncbi:hypothetical protein LY13_003863 [Prauserella aidingensis]|nr:hypothetical protein [Prauserella aidingensis]
MSRLDRYGEPLDDDERTTDPATGDDIRTTDVWSKGPDSSRTPAEPHECDHGWLDRDAERPRPCLICKPHLSPARRRRAVWAHDTGRNTP